MSGAHVYLHFAAGMAVGALLGFKPLLTRWYLRRSLHPGFAVWIVTTYAAGGFSLIPSLLRLLGAPEAFCRGWWMNAFVFHPLLDRLRPGAGMLVGQTVIVGILATQYILLLMALAAARKPAAKLA